MAMARRKGSEAQDASRGAGARERLIRAGLELITERGLGASGIDEVLRRAEAPKGSFYHHFHSKAEFAMVLVDEYNIFFRRKITKALLMTGRSAYDRIAIMIDSLQMSMERHGYRRGCLVGNISQEVTNQSDIIRARLEAVFREWEDYLANCLEEGKVDGSVVSTLDSVKYASFFWIGWEGAVMRSKLTQNAQPLERFAEGFLDQIRNPARDSVDQQGF